MSQAQLDQEPEVIEETNVQIEVTLDQLEPLNAYLCSVSFSLLNVDRDVFHVFLHTESSQKTILEFCTQQKYKSLIVSKGQSEEDEENDKNINISLEIVADHIQRHSIAFIKRPTFSVQKDQNPLEFKQSIQVINLGYYGHDTTPISINYNYMQNCFIPVFNANKDNMEKKSSSEKESYQVLLKKLNELNLVLIQCQQSVEVPEIQLHIEPKVKQIAQQLKNDGEKFSTKNFDQYNSDTEFIDALTKCIDKWARDVQSVLNFSSKNDFSTGTTLQEINYWQSYERSLNMIDQQIKVDEVLLTIKILEDCGKYQATTGWKYNLNFEKHLEKCVACNSFTKDFPINDLLSSHELKEVITAIKNIFNHMKKLSSYSQQYSLERGYKLLQAISKDLNTQITKILKSKRFMTIPAIEFIEIYEQCDQAFKIWEINFKEFQSQMHGRGVQRQGRNKTIIEFEHNVQIGKRVAMIYDIRRFNEKLKSIIQSIIQKESMQSGKHKSSFLNIEDIQEAYLVFQEIDVLDMSKEGENNLILAKQQYDMKIDKIESTIAQHMIDKLGQAQNSNQMFSVFAKFNDFLVKPKIAGAVNQYQTQLIQTVSKDIQNLQNKFLKDFNKTQNALITNVRDIPENAGKLIWANQINKKLEKYMERIQQVLGEKWDSNQEGKKCKEQGEAFQNRLKPDNFIEQYKKSLMGNQKSQFLKNKLFKIEVKQGRYRLTTNFESSLIQQYKELRTIKQQTQQKFSFLVQHGAQEINKIYPMAVSLIEYTRSYEQISSKIDPNALVLVANYRKQIHKSMEEGLSCAWEQKKCATQLASKFGEQIQVLEEQVNHLIDTNDQINAILISLKTCNADYNTFKDKLECIQKFIDEYSLKKYSNLHIWVNQLDKKIENVLAERLTQLITTWVNEFVHYKTTERTLITQTFVHEIKIKDSNIVLEPPVEYSRFYWFKQFHKILGSICSLPRIEANRYDKLQQLTNNKYQDYSSVLHQKIDPKILQKSYAQINVVLKDAEKYVKTWLGYQNMWKINTSKVYHMLEDDIDKWQQLLNEIKTGRNTFDNDDEEINFGAIIINYRLVQSKINSKYDQWHKEILNHFGETFGNKLRDFYKEVSGARGKLEKMNFSAVGGDLKEFINELMGYIIDLKNINENFAKWTGLYDSFKNGQKLLDRQKYQYPSDWMFIDQVDGEWFSFKQILNRKNQSYEKEISGLQNKIINYEKSLNDKIREIEQTWNDKKPQSGDLTPKDALDILNVLDGQLNRVMEDYIKCCKSKELLNLEPGNPEKLENFEEELKGLRESWEEMQKIWNNVESLQEVALIAASAKAIKESTELGFQMLEDLPVKMKSYESYEAMQVRLKEYQKMNRIIDDLKTEAMKPRHWKELLKKLKIQGTYQELTLGQLWSKNLLRYEKQIYDVFTTATGELVLENMLSGIKEQWNNFEMELVRYQAKCKLIRGWDELFAMLDEDLNNLNSMKISPYYKAFQEEIEPWDNKLQKYRITLDIWIDVQRRWVYLESIFFGSSDIKQQLSGEFQRFSRIDNEFVSLHKKVAQKPFIIDVMNIVGLQSSLERLGDQLAKIQKALGEYLEMQRQAFARFYFLGDEDLLEIIGNSKDVKAVQRHFNKMYAGITSLTADNVDGNDLVQGMNSKEGESVPFETPVNITEDNKINVWLTKVDNQMTLSLASSLEKSLKQVNAIQDGQEDELLKVIEQFPAQVILLGLQILWCSKIETAFQNQTIQQVIDYVVKFLSLLAASVVKNLKKDLRQKFEQIITDFVHQRDVSRELLKKDIRDYKDFGWQYHMRFYWLPKEQDVLKKLQIKMSMAQFDYGFEYLGVSEKLVQTPLTDRCYLTLTQALHLRLGGNPFGPAGTGKTESVKALGSQLGRFVLVFNCDETFDFHAMGRIFVGLCQVGAWGCFDEFNRLEERMLSAVSQQILIIQQGLRERQKVIHLMNRDVKLNFTMGIFVTMNPGYAGRSNLPENLKQLFRQMAMVKPDRELIAQVMLYSQGFTSAERLAGKIVSLFELCADQLSSQPHYDFGLRALKSVLVSSGNMKREELQKLDKELEQRELSNFEEKILLRSVCETIVPKLIADDVPLLQNLLAGVFPGSSIQPIDEQKLTENIKQICKERNYLLAEPFLQKMLQLYQIQRICHGVMMVGPSGSGKSAAWKVLLEAMYRVDKTVGQPYVIDPKAIHKDDLYGKLDNTTMEWTDGVFTGILRKITENQRGESQKRHWIIFDGDVDPEWAENLNSVLDDNKLLTLPNGERISIPPNVRIMFEVETLKYATLATVSRCGMVWFSDDLVTYEMVFHYYTNKLKQEDYDYVETDPKKLEERVETAEDKTRAECVSALQQYFTGKNSFGQQCVEIASKYVHVMDFTIIRVLEAAFALIRKGITNVLEYNENHSEYPLDSEVLKKYMQNWTLLSICWGISGSMTLKRRQEYSDEIREISPITAPPKIPGCESIIDYEVSLESEGEWVPWKKKVPSIEIDPHKVTDADLIITTTDTLRHQEVLKSWLSEKRPFLLCGPPGSGKTMTLMSTLKELPDFEMIFVNFSSGTYPSLILKQFDHYCEYIKTTSGIVLRPKQLNKQLVVFCDEINLPEQDKYSTMVVITFLRELTEQKGFWRPSDKQWISLERIQFIGACNPPTDVGRNPLSPRFLRHCPLILVDFPGTESLKQIYGTFNRAMLKRVPHLKSYHDCLTNAMVEFYSRSQNHFTSDIQSHYIYSPRELTRWKFAINEAIETLETQEDLVRLWAHEGLRLFYDRLVRDEEKQWCQKLIDEVGTKNFPSANINAYERPILFSNYLTKNYVSCDREELRNYIKARMKTFNEEQLDVQIVVFDSVIDHILRIDRVLRQPLGHLLLVGSSGVGKTTLSRFVSWMNNLTVFQIKAGRKYSLMDFDVDLRDVMKRAGVKGEKITFIFDESNVLSPAFLEKMNALLASGEIPGLFEGEEYMTLIAQCKEAAVKDNKIVDTEEQIYRNFIKNVQRNLHVVFTMNPNNPDFSNRTASSPALFNRCVIDWFGDWSQEAYLQVAQELTKYIDPSEQSFTQAQLTQSFETKNAAVVGAIVYVHNTVQELNDQLKKSAKKFNYITTRDFLDFIKHFEELYRQKSEQLAEQQRHLNTGLDKLYETEKQVIEMQAVLSGKQKELDAKEKEASEKLKLMVSEKSAAQTSKEQSIQLAEQCEIKAEEIKVRSGEVAQQLAEVEPMLAKAKNAVSSIKTDDLKFIQGLASPPPLIHFCMQAVVNVVKNTSKEYTWPEVKQIIKNTKFISEVIDYSTDSLLPKVRTFVMSKFITQAQWDIDKINRASKAAGPLGQWVESQLQYGTILEKVDPLRQEVKELEQQEVALGQKRIDLDKKVQMLEAKIGQLEIDYDQLTAAKGKIKQDMESVMSKVDRSKNLLQNLNSEKYRWDESCQNFKSQEATIIGDVLLAGAFSSYIGFFDHFYRKVVSQTWRRHLDEGAHIKFRSDLNMIEYLSQPAQRLNWQIHGLPSDDLCTENAIILNRFKRYPLVIDPSGQALKFIMSFYADKKISTSSFADEGFIKNLETCLRFGFPLLVQDVEKIDPILNSVLNKESYKTGGRVLIRVGDQEIDFSPNFQMFMITRDSTARFTPDLCSRVTFINFTVTRSSLENQCLNTFMKSETPDTEAKRIRQMKLQGEYAVQLRELEDKLLDALQNVQGSILENEQVISTLETLKKESTEVKQKMQDSDKVQAEVAEVTNQYRPLASACSSVYFVLSDMSQIHYLYEFSLNFFMNIFDQLIEKNEEVNKIPKNELEKRRVCIKDQLFLQVYQRVQNSILANDRMILALKLAQIKLGNDYKQPIMSLIRDSQILETSLSNSLLQGKLNKHKLKLIEDLGNQYGTLINHIEKNEDQWLYFINAVEPEKVFPEGWEPQDLINSEASMSEREKQVRKIIRNMQLIKAFRADRFEVIASQLIETVMGKEFLNDIQIDMAHITQNEANPKSPLLMCSSPGFDPSFRVEGLSKENGTRLISVAIGSEEGFVQAEKAIQQAAKNGVWVLLKNVHLAPQWLNEVEKTIHSIKPHNNFRLFLTMEFCPKVPSTLIRQCYKLVFEPPSGIKASLQRTYKTLLTPAVCDQAPRERARLHFLLAWLHSILLERLRYTPTGYTKVYEFNEADQRCALDLINENIDALGERNNIDPEQIPWDAIKTILTHNLYGAKIDNDYDAKILQSLVDNLFTPQSFDSKSTLFTSFEKDVTELKVPEALRQSQFVDWIDNLPNVESPVWSGLPLNVEKIFKESMANRVLQKLWDLQDVNEEEITTIEPSQGKTKKPETQLQWLKDLNVRVDKYLEILPKTIQKGKRDADSMNNPLFRFLEREITVAQKMLKLVLNNLNEIKLLCEGQILPSIQLRTLAQQVYGDQVPPAWLKQAGLDLKVNEWVIDYKKRIEQFSQLAQNPNYQKQGVIFGKLIYPEAYMTATRQFVCQKHGWSLDELELKAKIWDGSSEIDDQSFLVYGMNIEGASWDKETQLLVNSNDVTVPLDPIVFTWVNIPKEQRSIEADDIMVPVYMNKFRKQLVFSLKMKSGNLSRNVLYQKAIALVAWNE